MRPDGDDAQDLLAGVSMTLFVVACGMWLCGVFG